MGIVKLEIYTTWCKCMYRYTRERERERERHRQEDAQTNDNGSSKVHLTSTTTIISQIHRCRKKHKYFIQTLHFNATDQNTWRDKESIWVGWSVKSGWRRYRGDRASLACRWWRTPPGSGRSSQAVDRAEQQDQLLTSYLMPSQPQKSSWI